MSLRQDLQQSVDWLEISAGGASLPSLTSVGGLDIVPPEERRANLRAVAERALRPDALEMSTWHTCDTTHCIAGWAQVLAGGKYADADPASAGVALLGPEAGHMFYADDDTAREFLERALLEDAL